MRTSVTALSLLGALAVAGCTAEPAPSSRQTPSGPCAAEREQPPDGSEERRTQADLDGDQRTDEIVTWTRGNQRLVQAWLATGQNAEPQILFNRVLEAADVDGDGRATVFAAISEDTGRAYVLEGCELVPVMISGTNRLWEYSLGPGSSLVCGPRGFVEEAVTEGVTEGEGEETAAEGEGQETVRRAWNITGRQVTGTQPVGSGPVTRPGVKCS